MVVKRIENKDHDVIPKTGQGNSFLRNGKEFIDAGGIFWTGVIDFPRDSL